MTEFDALIFFIDAYCKNIKDNLEQRWNAYTPRIRESHGSDAMAGLLARQATLAIEIARNPGIWNGNIAAMLLRTMTDTHITLAWILENPDERGKEYIMYGLGQEKLHIEHLTNEASSAPNETKPDLLQDLIEMREEWLHSQIAHWAIDVNLGSWSGKSTRQMALECDCEGLYKFAYVPFSAATHSMWNHVGIYNVESCRVAMHKHHYLPCIREFDPDADFLYRSSKYISKSFSAFTEKTKSHADVLLPVEFFAKNFPRDEREAGDEEQGSE